MSGLVELPGDAPRVGDGRYVLLTRLGEGGMAVVYGAWDTQDEAWRAVKVLLPEYAKKRSVRRRFAREAEAMMAISHPNLVRVLDVDDQSRLPYLVMELVPGGSLQEWALRNGKMPARLAATCGVQICEGLAAVHAVGVVHRDVKPQNVLVDAEGTLKLTDFGVAQMEGGDTKTGVAMGTLGYMSPEQLSDSKSVDPRSDIYSLGASLYVLLTHATVRDLFRIADDPSRVEGIPPTLVPVLRRCLQYEREDRYGSVQELQEALREAEADLPPLPEGSAPLPRRADDARPGVPAGEFTELQGMLETTMPTFTDEVTRPPESTDVPDGEETPIFPERTDEDQPDPAPLDLSLSSSSSHGGEAPHPVEVAVAPKPRAVVVPDRPSVAARVASGLVWATLLIGLPVVVALVLTPLMLGAGRSTVLDAVSTHQEAERVLLDRVRDADELPAELAALGLDAQPAVAALAAFHQASDEDRLASAQAFVDATMAAARPLSISGGPRGHEFELARQRVQRLEWAGRQLDEARAGWDAATHSPLGSLAVGAGLAPRPP